MKFSLSLRTDNVNILLSKMHETRRDATRHGAGDLQHHVGNCIRLRRNGKERIYRNKLPPRSRD